MSDTAGESVFAEVYWEELSRTPHGLVGTLVGFLKLIFGLRWVAWHAADPVRETEQGQRAEVFARGLRGVCLIVGRTLRGPMAATTAAWAFGWIVGVVILGFRPPGAPTETWAVGTVVGVCVVTLLVGCLGLRTGLGPLDKHFCRSLVVATLIALTAIRWPGPVTKVLNVEPLWVRPTMKVLGLDPVWLGSVVKVLDFDSLWVLVTVLTVWLAVLLGKT